MIPKRSEDLSKNDGGILRSGARRTGTTAPGGPVIGDIWFDTSQGALKVWNGTLWIVAGSGGAGSVTSPGIELYHPASTPYIDFHRAANPTGDGGADFNVRLINSASGVLELVSGSLVASSGRVVAGGASTGDAETLETHGGGSGISIRDRDNNGLRSVVYSNAGRGRLWRGNDVLTWTSSEIQLDVRTLGPNDRPLVECVAGSALTGGGAEVGIIMQAGTTVINYAAGNSNFSYPAGFPHGVLSVVIINGDSGGSAGGPNVVYSTSNTSTVASGTSAVSGSTGAGINGNSRLNFIVVGW